MTTESTKQVLGPVGFRALNSIQRELAADDTRDFPSAISASLRSDAGNPYAIEACIRASAAHYAVEWKPNEIDEFINSMHRGAQTPAGAESLRRLSTDLADAIDAKKPFPIEPEFTDDADYSTSPAVPGKGGATVTVPSHLACKGDPPIIGMGPVGFAYIQTTVRDYAAATTRKPSPDGGRPTPTQEEVDTAIEQLATVDIDVVKRLLDTRILTVEKPQHYDKFLTDGLKNFSGLNGPDVLRQVAEFVVAAIKGGNVGFTIEGFVVDDAIYSVERTTTGCVVYVPNGRDCPSDPLPPKSKG